MTAVERQIRPPDDRERHERSVGARCVDFFGDDPGEVDRRGRQQSDVRHAAAGRERIPLRRVRPTLELDHRSRPATVGIRLADRAAEGQRHIDRGRETIAYERRAPDAREPAIEIVEIECIARRRDAVDHARRLRHRDARVGRIAAPKVEGGHGETRRPPVRQRIRAGAAQDEAGNVVVIAHDLPPRNHRTVQACQRRGVRCDLVLHAVLYHRDRPRRAGLDQQIGAIFGCERDARGVAVPEDRAIASRIAAEAVRVHASFRVTRALRRTGPQRGRAVVIERPSVLAPRWSTERNAVDPLAQQTARRDLDDAQHLDLGSAFGDPDRNVPVVERGRIVIDRIVAGRRARETIRIEHEALA